LVKHTTIGDGESDAGLHLDSSDHILKIDKKLMGTVDEVYSYHIEMPLYHFPGVLVLPEEGAGKMLTALLSPVLVNSEWGGRKLLEEYQERISRLMNLTVVDIWTMNVLWCG